MKRIFIFLLSLICFIPSLNAQVPFHLIDQEVREFKADHPQALAFLIHNRYQTEIEKVRAIYSWIAQHISYNTGVLSSGRAAKRYSFQLAEEDTSAQWLSANEMTAIRVMKRRKAICDGYSKLLKTLCDYAGIRSEIITGFARSYFDIGRFRTNHSWNAVRVDSNWYLVDVTWGSGYISSGFQFVHQLDDRYFLADPKEFIDDHYPEDLSWTLLPDPPEYKEYQATPYFFKSFEKYHISAVYPGKGIIEASAGDTIKFEIHLAQDLDKRPVSADPFFDSSFLERTPAAIFISPVRRQANKIYFQFVADTQPLQWVYIMFNDDIILRYRINLKLKSPNP